MSWPRFLLPQQGGGKPRVWFRDGCWQCGGGGVVAYGAKPFVAYCRWHEARWKGEFQKLVNDSNVEVYAPRVVDQPKYEEPPFWSASRPVGA